MIMIHRIAIFLLSIANFTLTIANSNNSTHCKQTCGHKTVNHPFGFSEDCEFRLNCNVGGEMNFKGFEIRNITSDNLVLNLSPNCTRPIDTILQLFGKTYALTSLNRLLLRNCSSILNGCVVSSGLLQSRFGPGECDGGLNQWKNMSCYASDQATGGILRYEDVTMSGCKYLYSSIVMVDNENSGENSAKDYGGAYVSLELKRVQLGWWRNGICGCHKNAKCTTVGSAGYRCRCREGFIGDGFLDGNGCREGFIGDGFLDGNGKGSTTMVIIIITIPTILSLIAVAIIFYIFFKRRKNLNNKDIVCVFNLTLTPLKSQHKISLRRTNLAMVDLGSFIRVG